MILTFIKYNTFFKTHPKFFLSQKALNDFAADIEELDKNLCLLLLDKENAYMSQDIATIYCDVPIETDFETVEAKKAWDEGGDLDTNVISKPESGDIIVNGEHIQCKLWNATVTTEPQILRFMAQAQA